MLPLSAFIAALLTTLGILSAPLIVWAYRGRKVCDHPYCRRCGFDLFGRPPTSPQCSECGAELGVDTAIRIGKWKRRPAHLFTGLLLLVLSATYWVAQTVPAINHIQVTLKPTWWLLIEGRSFNSPSGQEALAELADRCRRSALSAGQARQVATVLLAIQANPAAKWNGEYGNAIEQAFTNGHVTAAQWQGYCLLAQPLTLNVRKTVRRGDPLPMELLDGLHFIRATIPDFYAAFKATALQVGGIDCPPPDWEKSWVHTSNNVRDGGRGDGIIRLPKDVVSKLSDGPNQVTIWLDGHINGIRARVLLQATFNLVSADTKTVTFVTPAVHRDAVLAVYSTIKVVRPPGWQSGQTFVDMPWFTKPPVPVAVKVVVCKGSQEWLVGRYCSEAIDLADVFKVFHADVVPGDKVDVVMRPDADAAVLSVNAVEFWGEEIVIKDIVVVEDRHK